MWLCLYDSFLSIVHKDCADDELLVRARRPNDIEKIWPDAQVVEVKHADYLYRAVIKKSEVIDAINREINDIDYSNFKNDVKNTELHNAYLDVWQRMAKLQPTKPWTGATQQGTNHGHT